MKKRGEDNYYSLFVIPFSYVLKTHFHQVYNWIKDTTYTFDTSQLGISVWNTGDLLSVQTPVKNIWTLTSNLWRTSFEQWRGGRFWRMSIQPSQVQFNGVVYLHQQQQGTMKRGQTLEDVHPTKPSAIQRCCLPPPTTTGKNRHYCCETCTGKAMVEEAMKSYWFTSWSVTAGRDSGQEGSSATRLEISFCSDSMSAEGRQQQQQRVPECLVLSYENYRNSTL